MTIQDFAVLLEKGEERSPLLEALQRLRSCSPEHLHASHLADWTPWSEDRAPQALLDKREVRN